jgi:catechol 2,3-dioxygenase-like lactoylglutathione lyase family enzyme
MKPVISQMIDAFTLGRITRRELIQVMSGLVAAAATGVSLPACGEDVAPTFKATGLNHIALRVKDVAKSRDFYIKHLGLNVSNESLPDNCFLLAGEHNFITLFRGDPPKLDHYCYSIEHYDVNDAAAKLRALGIEPKVESGRIYFPDPDGHTVQLASPSHMP